MNESISLTDSARRHAGSSLEMAAEMRLIGKTAVIGGVRRRPALAQKGLGFPHPLVGEKSMRGDVKFLSEGADQMGAAEPRQLRKFLQPDIVRVVFNEIVACPCTAELSRVCRGTMIALPWRSKSLARNPNMLSSASSVPTLPSNARCAR